MAPVKQKAWMSLSLKEHFFPGMVFLKSGLKHGYLRCENIIPRGGAMSFSKRLFKCFTCLTSDVSSISIYFFKYQSN